MKGMGRAIRTLAAVLAGLALVAALPAPCGCLPERSASKHADEHACCAPPTGVRATDHDCCDQAPVTVDAVPSPGGSDAMAPVATALLVVATPSVHRVLVRAAVSPGYSPPLTVLRI